MKKLLIIFLLFIPFGLLFSQDITYNEEFQIDTYTWYADNHTDPSITGLSDGGFVACWEGEDFNTSYDIKAQIFDNFMKSKGDEFRVNTFTQGWQRNPSLCSLAKDEFVICWEDASQALYTGIYGQIYNEDGTTVGSEFQVNTFNEKWQINVSVCDLVNENFVACWQSFEQDGDDYGIFAQIFNNLGTKVGNEIQVNSEVIGTQSNPKVMGLNNGGFVISWESGQNGIGYQIKAQLFDKNGSIVGHEFQVNTKMGYENYSSITSLSNGGFVISWQSSDKDITEYGIFAQIFDEDGTKLGNEIQVSISTNNRQTNPDISMLSDSSFSICWESGGDIYSKVFKYNGEEFGSKFKVNSFTSHSQTKSRITELTEDRFLICWQSDGQNLFTDGIYGKYFLNTPLKQIIQNFELVLPENKDSLKIDYPKFIWNQAIETHLNFPWELVYDLFIDIDESFTNPLIIYGIQDTIYQIDALTPGETYYWKVRAINYFGDSLWSSNISSVYIKPDAISGLVEADSLIPGKFKLSQNYPNPFNPTTIIKYTIPLNVKRETANVKLVVYDVLGKEVATLVDKELPAGSYEVEFSANTLASGIYFYRLKNGSFIETKKMILLR